MNTICISCTRLFKTKTYNKQCRSCASVDSGLKSLSGKLVCAKILDESYPKYDPININGDTDWIFFGHHMRVTLPVFDGLTIQSYVSNHPATFYEPNRVIDYKYSQNLISYSVWKWTTFNKYIQTLWYKKNDKLMYAFHIWNKTPNGCVREHAFYSEKEFEHFIYSPMIEFISSSGYWKCLPKDIINLIMPYLHKDVEKYH